MPLTFKEINLPTTTCKDKKEGNKGNKLKTIRGDGPRINFVGTNQKCINYCKRIAKAFVKQDQKNWYTRN